MAACGLLGAALAGCGAGQDAPTAQDLPSVPGVNVTLDGIAVRNATVPAGDEYPAGGTVPIEFSLVNETDGEIRLQSATSELADSVESTGSGTVAVPAFGIVPVTLEATGLAEDLNATSSLPLELTFRNGVVVSLDVPMAPPVLPAPRSEPLEVGHH